MKALFKGWVIADSDDIVEHDGYHYFPAAHVRVDWLESADKTASDLQCPQGVQFYDVVIDGERHARAAWRDEAPRQSMSHVADRFGFWNEVEVG
jgi:uncharacterized protein (DUF427 family)